MLSHTLGRDEACMPMQFLVWEPDGRRQETATQKHKKTKPGERNRGQRDELASGDRWKLLDKTDEDGDVWSASLLHWERRG